MINRETDVFGTDTETRRGGKRVPLLRKSGRCSDGRRLRRQFALRTRKSSTIPQRDRCRCNDSGRKKTRQPRKETTPLLKATARSTLPSRCGIREVQSDALFRACSLSFWGAVTLPCNLQFQIAVVHGARTKSVHLSNLSKVQ